METKSHNEYVAGIYDRAAGRYDETDGGTFFRCAEILVAHAGALAGSSVVDVGTGTGAIPMALRDRAVGKILGIDISNEMLARAGRRFEGQPHVRFEQMSATELSIPDSSFRVAFCSQALPFFPSRLRALRELHRVLEPGGTLAVGVRGAPDPVWQVLSRLVHFFGADAPIMGCPFLTQDWTTELLDDVVQAGFRTVSSHRDAFVVSFPSFEHVWEHLWASGFRASLERIPYLRLEEFRESASAGLDALREGPAIASRVEVISVIGHKVGGQ